MSYPSNILFVEKLQEVENPGVYVDDFGELCFDPQKEQQMKIEE